MSRRETILERLHPDVQEFTALANEWKVDAIGQLLGFFWKGCDALINEIIEPVGGVNAEDKSLERSLNTTLAPRVCQNIPSECPFYFHHKPDEFATQQTPSAQPPEPDFAFVSRINERSMFQIEAKVLKTDGQVSEYVKEINDNFLTCRYGPFSREGAMVGYLLSGKAKSLFSNISNKLSPLLSVPKTAKKRPPRLSQYSNFINRNHKVSNHIRKVPSGKNYEILFRCHHMILEVGSVFFNSKTSSV